MKKAKHKDAIKRAKQMCAGFKERRLAEKFAEFYAKERVPAGYEIISIKLNRRTGHFDVLIQPEAPETMRFNLFCNGKLVGEVKPFRC